MSILGLGTSTTNIYSQSVAGQANSSATTAPQATTDSSIVGLSSAAKQLAKSANTFEDVGIGARAKLDALIQKTAQKTGVSPHAVNVQAIQVSDYSGFSDQELAAMSLNSSKNFSVAEIDEAKAVLAARMAVSLEPYRAATNAGDRRGHTMAINALYDKMSPEVRSALGWTPTMMISNNSMLHGDSERFGKQDPSSILNQLRSAALNGGLSFNTD